jgi:MATE family multidrug resistance protein
MEPAGAAEAVEEAVAHPDATSMADAGGSWELFRLALPLIVSQSFMTVQIFVDTVLLSWHDPQEMTASFPAVMWYWQFFGLLQVTAGYTSTFVAQYIGAKRPNRVGPAVWQGIYFATIAGIAFLAVVPAAPFLISLGEHSSDVQKLEVTYLRCLSFAALPMLVMGAVNGFFSGRQQTWTVLVIEGVGTAVNVGLALLLIFGRWGCPEMGIEGAGWATAVGSWTSALLALVLMFRKKYRGEFGTLSGWKPERELFGRLMKYGGPAGMQVFLDVVVFNMFVQLVGRLGDAALGATTLAVRLNMIAFLPMFGLGQAVCILVGQRLGGNRPDLAEKSVYTGLRWMFGYMCLVALNYVAVPGLILEVFERDDKSEKFAAIAAVVPQLLLYVALFSVVDAVNLSFAFALRGAGDTRFVTVLTFALAWPLMVIPTYLVVRYGGSVYTAWIFITAHIFAMSVCFWLRFRTGKWKAMRVIEPENKDDLTTRAPDALTPRPPLPAGEGE